METKISGEVAPEVQKDSTAVEATTEPAKELSFREELEKGLKEEKPTSESDKKELVAKPEAKIEQKEPQKEITPPVLAPADMTPEEKEVFSKAEPKLQSYLSRRAYENRAALSREMQKVQEKSKVYEGLERAIEPHRDYLYKLGVTPEAALNKAIAWDQAVARDRISGAKEWLASYGIDPFELIDENTQPQQQQQQQAQPVDPERIKQEIYNEINQKFQIEEQARTTEQHLNAVEKFKSSKILFKDPNTALQLEADLAPVIESLVRQNPNAKAEDVLETAYSYVTKGNDKYSALLDAYGQREKAEQARQAAEKAKQASRSISGGLAGSNPVKEGLSFREEIRLRMQGGM